MATFAALPAEASHCCCDAPLLGGTDAADGRKAKRAESDLGNGRVRESIEIGPDRLFPRIGLIPRLLLRHDALALEILVRPPRNAVPIQLDGTSEQLIAITTRNASILMTLLTIGQKPAPAGLVAQIGILVGGANEDALPWLYDFLASIAGASSVQWCE